MKRKETVRAANAAGPRPTDAVDVEDGSAANADLSDRLRRLALEAVSDVLGGARGVALLGFPDHGNVGDSAIWLGQLALLHEVGIGRPRYLAGRRTYDRRSLDRRLRGGDVILLSGGGNLGDMWPEEQALRERVLRDFPDRRVIQLPQSIHFRHEDALKRAGRVFRGHPDFQLLVRDEQSLRIANDELGVEAVLCPDMAFGLTPGPESPSPGEPSILLLAREDREARGEWGDSIPGGGSAPRVVRSDWTEDETDVRIWLSSYLRRLLIDHPRTLDWIWRGGVRLDDAAARARLERGIDLLSAHRAVMTDRLHGHILCLLIGRPHVLLDNSYGKLSAFYRTWTSGSPISIHASDPREGLRAAMDLAFAESSNHEEARF